MLMTFHKGDYMGCSTWHIHIVGIVTPFLSQQPNNRMWFKSDWMEDVFSTWNDRSAFPGLCKFSLYCIYSCSLYHAVSTFSGVFKQLPRPNIPDAGVFVRCPSMARRRRAGNQEIFHRRLFWAMGIQISVGDLQNPDIWSYVKVPYV